jgi:peptide/nickel transport system permease protein
MNRAGVRKSEFPAVPRPYAWAGPAWLILLMAAGAVTQWLPAPAAGTPLAFPSGEHWLGTDLLGRDFGWRMLAGGARTFGLAAGAAAVSILVGGVWGIAAGFTGGRLDKILTRSMDAALAVPALILGLMILAAFGPGDAVVVCAAGVGGSATFARLMRAEAARLVNREFLIAARALGADGLRRVVRHLLPNLSGALAAYGALHFGWAVAYVASLTFLGFGGAPSSPEWGRMLGEARLVFGRAPWQAMAPGLALALTVLAVQRSGEAWLDRGRE